MSVHSLVLTRKNAELVLEHSIEMRMVLKSHTFDHIRHTHIRFDQKSLCLVEQYFLTVPANRITCKLFDDSVQVVSAVIQFAGQSLSAVLSRIFFHKALDLFEQLFFNRGRQRDIQDAVVFLILQLKNRRSTSP